MSSTLETIRQLFAGLKTTHGKDTSTVCEQITALFPLLLREDQKEFSSCFYKWAGKNKTKQPLIFCYARFLCLADNFYSEQYEWVLQQGPALQKAFLENNEQEAAAAIGAFIGNIHRTLGNTDLSLKTLWDVYGQLNRSDRFMHYRMSCSFHIGSIYLDLGNHEEALPVLKNTLSLAEKMQNSFWIVYTFHGLGRLYLKQKNYENARLMFEEAMDAAGRSGKSSLLSSAQTEMGNYYFETGDYDASEVLHTKAVETRVANKFIGGAITNYIRLGEINMKQSEPEEAIAVLNKGLQLAEQIKVKPKMFQIHLLLSEIYHGRKDLGKSLFHYKQYDLLKEQAGQEDNAKKVKNVKLLFEAEQTKKENIIIKRQKAEIQQKNIELQDIIDELTITKAGKKAKAFTLLIAILFFIFEDSILHVVLPLVPYSNFYFSLAVKMVIIFSLQPINSAIEHYLVRKVIKKKRKMEEDEEGIDIEVPADLNFAA